MRRFARRLSPFVLSIAPALAACSGANDGGGSRPSGASGADAGSDALIGDPPDAGGAEEGGTLIDGGGDDGGGGGPGLVAEVFGHSATTLFRLDPTTKAVTTVGQFTTSGDDMIDIALDKDSNLYGTSFGALWKVDKNTAVATKIASGGYPNSLSFVPAGTVDPMKEALVGYQSDIFGGSTYVRIDTTTGAITAIGPLGAGYQSSGDIVSAIGGGTYLTVIGPGCGDCLVEVDAATGAMKKNWGPVQFGAVYGVAFWDGVVYGFTNAGSLFQLDFVGGALQSHLIAIPNALPGLSFYGAGSTTAAPVGPVH